MASVRLAPFAQERGRKPCTVLTPSLWRIGGAARCGRRSGADGASRECGMRCWQRPRPRRGRPRLGRRIGC